MKPATKAPGYIAVEGPIGVGKTSLVKRLAESLGYETLLEDAKTNPFLDDFYQSPRAMAFQTQVYFLLQRARQLRQLVAAPKQLVADFLLDKDPLFAAITLSEPELALYEEIYQQRESICHCCMEECFEGTRGSRRGDFFSYHKHPFSLAGS
ncbi:MAG: hypothetical protein EOO07_16600 [Chitinophagaceae bacterium]|nr:MAG: hypothetical protein EOO07_16600 [Chitinophagaceae bacterium]